MSLNSNEQKSPFTEELENRFLFQGSLNGLLGAKFVEQTGKLGRFR